MCSSRRRLNRVYNDATMISIPYHFLLVLLLICIGVSEAKSVFRLPNTGSKSLPVLKTMSRTKLCTTSRPGLVSSCLSIRGGSDSEYDSDFDFSDDDMFGFDDLDADNLEDDFSEQSTLSLAYQAFQKSPPLTKIYLTASFLCSSVGYLQNKNEFPSYFLLDWKPILKGQIWRPITAFFNFGPIGLGWLMTAHFVWTYMSTLERLNHSKPYEFWYMIFFGCTSMVMGYTFLNISPRFLGHNLSTFLVYVWSRYHEGLEVNMFEMFQTRAEMLPWFFLAQTFLLEGEFPILDLLGIAFGHVYHYLASIGGIGRCPNFIKEWYENGDDSVVNAIRAEYKKISSDFEMQ
uniref:Derlin n=1 Tax=Chaetoceros debilis TaxID=122233 RepID=A0A7S3QJ48_9STRA|mmetsp:Transcript_9370/g.14016  ORF Transcript_9370/g.14016 Transcript_9370/m.14016 type:complete len:346 (-) Transcript_9370:37-1074(-)|eukprot:CAMPEP_0194122430 /NCGR_PEP_ID=MMETSP0150-20130528/50657_1 /TAXON_ID=122233 /ORGANISM="Chaetoceros debilis, Strain MM31A-1" /LENGTH=345 /DNA_ID=CAMNT_0038815299 /DNA_START=1 /DNA_END=1038 /DNA_ORIENTATION=+